MKMREINYKTAAFAAILTVITAISLFLYMAISKSEDDIQL